MVAGVQSTDQNGLAALEREVESLRFKLASMTKEGGTLSKLASEQLNLTEKAKTFEKDIKDLRTVSAWNVSWRLLMFISFIAIVNLGLGFLAGSWSARAPAPSTLGPEK